MTEHCETEVIFLFWLHPLAYFQCFQGLRKGGAAAKDSTAPDASLGQGWSCSLRALPLRVLGRTDKASPRDASGVFSSPSSSSASFQRIFEAAFAPAQVWSLQCVGVSVSILFLRPAAACFFVPWDGVLRDRASEDRFIFPAFLSGTGFLPFLQLTLVMCPVISTFCLVEVLFTSLTAFTRFSWYLMSGIQQDVKFVHT